MKPPPKNLAASVRDRLKQRARERGESFDLVLVRYGIERLLYRLSRSPLRRRFVLKGAMLFTAWEGFLHRETRDLDLMGFGTGTPAELAEAFGAVCRTAVPEDGLVFGDIGAEPIRAIEEYGGVRLTVRAKLAGARITIQVDVGFGNRITPPPRELVFPALLEFPAPVLRAYPVETVIAEKLQALVGLGLRNGRLKDYYDLWHLGQRSVFAGAVLAAAIRATFRQRRTPFPAGLPAGLTERYHDDALRRTAWTAFCRKLSARSRPVELAEVVAFLRGFLVPVLEAAARDGGWAAHWPAGGPWREAE